MRVQYPEEDRGYETPCWIWQGSLTQDGYGKHRQVWRKHVGPIPAGHDLHHLCGVRRCVNPTHLAPVNRHLNRASRGPGKPGVLREVDTAVLDSGVLLQTVEEARELRDIAAREFVRAIVRASEAGHSLRQIASAGGISFAGVRFILNRERNSEK